MLYQLYLSDESGNEATIPLPGTMTITKKKLQTTIMRVFELGEKVIEDDDFFGFRIFADLEENPKTVVAGSWCPATGEWRIDADDNNN